MGKGAKKHKILTEARKNKNQERNASKSAHHHVEERPQREDLSELVKTSTNWNGLRGLNNLGNSCFFNSVIQNLVQTVPLRNHLVPRDPYNPHSPLSLPKPKELELSSAFRSLLIQMWLGNGNRYNPSELFYEIGRKVPRFSRGRQQDAHELLRFLLGEIDTEIFKVLKIFQKDFLGKPLPKLPDQSNSSEGAEQVFSIPFFVEKQRGNLVSNRNSNLTDHEKKDRESLISYIENVFGGRIESTITCHGCGNESSTYETFLDLSIPIPNRFLDDRIKRAIGLIPEAMSAKQRRAEAAKLQANMKNKSQNVSSKTDSAATQNAENKSNQVVEENQKVEKEQTAVAAKAAAGRSLSKRDKRKLKHKTDAASRELGRADKSDDSEQTRDLSMMTEEEIIMLALEEDERAEVLETIQNHQNNNKSQEDIEKKEETQTENKDQTQTENVDPIISTNSNNVVDSNEIKTESNVTSNQVEKVENLSELENSQTEKETSTEASLTTEEKVDKIVDKEEEQQGKESPVSSLQDDSVSSSDIPTLNVSSLLNPKLNHDIRTISRPIRLNIDSCLYEFTEPEVLSGPNGFGCYHCTKKQWEAQGKDLTPLILEYGTEEEKSALQAAMLIEDVIEESDSLSEDIKSRSSIEQESSCNVVESNANLVSNMEESQSEDSITASTTSLEDSQSTQLADAAAPVEATTEEYSVKDESISKDQESSAAEIGQVTEKEASLSDSCDYPSLPPKKPIATQVPKKGESMIKKNTTPEDQKEVPKESKKSKSKAPSLVKQTATKQILIDEMPQVLTLHLKRFWQTMSGFQKLDQKVDFPTLLDLSPYTSRSAKSRIEYTTKNKRRPLGSCRYQLYGIVVHSGGMDGGHYVAYTRRRENPLSDTESLEDIRNGWYYYSDLSMSSATLETVTSQQAYILFYEKISEQDSTTNLL